MSETRNDAPAVSPGSLPRGLAPSTARAGRRRALRVLFLTNMYPSAEEPWFGCFVKELADALADLGVEVQVLQIDGRARRLNYLSSSLELRKRVARESFDLVHAHYGLSGAAALSQRSVPVVTTFHGSDTHSPRWQRHLSWLVARATMPIFVSPEGALNLGLPGAPVVPSAVDLALFAPQDRRGARRSLGWAENGRYVLFPASPRERQKRYDLFEAALAAARSTLPELRPVVLEGFSRREVALVMNAVDVTVLTSDREGSPVSVKESLACGTPVVSVPVGDVQELLPGLPGCDVVPRDASALGSAIVAAVAAGSDSALRHRVEPLSTQCAARKVLALYELALARTTST